MNARHDALKVRKTLSNRSELRLECRVFEQVLNSIQTRIDVRDLSQRGAKPDSEETFACGERVNDMAN